MTLRPLVAIAVLAILSACGPDKGRFAAPREPDATSIGFFCRMGLAEHAGPKGQILPKGWTDPLWFSSVRDALTYVATEVVSDREIAGFWVNDMAHGTWEKPAPGSWIEAQKAWYVVESRKSSGMGGSETIPFKAREAAETFAKENGGRVVGYAEAKRAVLVETPSINGGET